MLTCIVAEPYHSAVACTKVHQGATNKGTVRWARTAFP
jgi:hypothetical protein